MNMLQQTMHVSYSSVSNTRALKYLGYALGTASFSDCSNKHGAVIEKNGRVLSRACNRFRNHPSVVSEEHVKTGCTVHAEVAAIKLAGSCEGATIYVARLGNIGPLLSRPCINCYNAILRAGITEIVHT